jgi:hypothetical protein
MTTFKIVLFESQISFIVRKLLCRNEVNPNGLFLKVIEGCHDVYNLIIDRRNCISEFSKIKKRNPRKVHKSLKR